MVKKSNAYSFSLTTINAVPANGRVKFTFPYTVSLDSVIKVYDKNNNVLSFV